MRRALRRHVQGMCTVASTDAITDLAGAVDGVVPSSSCSIGKVGVRVCKGDSTSADVAVPSCG